MINNVVALFILSLGKKVIYILYESFCIPFIYSYLYYYMYTYIMFIINN